MTRRPPLIPDDEGAGRIIPAVLAVMTFMALLALAGGLLLNRAVAGWRAELAGTLTVELPAPVASDAAVARAAAALGGTAGIAGVRPLPVEEARRLLEPWLGSAGALDELPLPRLIDVRLDPERPPDRELLLARLAEAAPGATVDDHGEWLARLSRLVDGALAVAAATVLAIAAATAAVVVFAMRAAFAAHREVVELLHLMGARDGYIARHFQVHALKLGLRGGLAGLGLAGIALLLLWQLADAVATPLLGHLRLEPLELAALLAILPAVAGIAVLAARFTVLGALRRMP